ncbi:uncharacterized protein FIBRA_06631 [Fibroporia radiculosa]|uniref:SURF1-like protein n=1 Tax=Fibroporia radiculosa TaxID=599839 RepID=J4IBD1_9APHY|nr:uncharacterized protein FIBRA_06631 [Fibroporia radiculosa]CCM04451.1 predicted protein [Fibroporia radiculosa]
MVLAGIIPAFTFALGTWQVKRLKWKVAMIDELEEKLQREPMSLPKRVNLAAIPDFAYRKVMLKGRWDAEHAMLLGPRVRDGTNGYHLVVPLIRSDGSTVLVDRGFVSKDMAGDAKCHLEDGETQILGMLRTSHVRNNFTPNNDPEKGEWYWADISAMAEYAGGEQTGVQPVYIEEIFGGHGGEVSSRLARGIPVGRAPTVDVRNAHASYVVTCYVYKIANEAATDANAPSALTSGHKARPSSSTDHTTSNLNADATGSPSAEQGKHLRICFPHGEDRASLVDDIPADSMRLRSSPGLRKSILGQGKDSLLIERRHDFGRRRVRSVDMKAVSPHIKRHSVEAGDVTTRYSRRVSHTGSRGVQKEREPQSAVLSDGQTDLSLSSAFSDEYDLSREGMSGRSLIIEDVRHAVRLKARREARLKAAQAYSHTEHQSKSDVDPFNSRVSPVKTHLQIHPTIAAAPEVLNNDSEIDFSPSIGTIPLHPVPSSSNGGATLDWSGSASEDEKSDKKWTLHLSKKKQKERQALPSSRIVVERQDSLYADKLARIREKAHSRTLRKAAITSDQLARRYSILLTPPSSHVPFFNLLQVVRWYDGQEAIAKASLDKTEPFTWLKHLDKGGRDSPRIPWHVTASIVEEYIKSRHNQIMATIPEDEVVKSSPIAPSFPENMSPSSGSHSWNPSPQFLEPSLSRRRSSYDQQLSFEPHVESGRESVIGESRPSSEGFTRYWKQSHQITTESAPSSLYSFKLNGGGSSAKSNHNLRNVAKRLRRKPYDSEDALSSARNSVSERSVSEDVPTKIRGYMHSRPTTPGLLSPDELHTDDDKVSYEAVDKGNGDGLPTSTLEKFPKGGDIIGTPTPETAVDRHEVSPSLSRFVPIRRLRTSLPTSHRALAQEREQRQRAVDEEIERQEYERKARILEETASQNYRIRYLLQRVAATIREYDVVQSGFITCPEVLSSAIPSDVLEAFSHDPSAFTSSTRSVKGWKAVEDIHERIRRQRKLLRAFASSMAFESAGQGLQTNVFDDPISSMGDALKKLEEHHSCISSQADRVTDALVRVKAVHQTVKEDYNNTLAHTSLVYPELSQIIALEESYRSHYQQFWDIGLDALTLLLDTVTPFWRNYGKVIGEDVQDFLIIPWYRNEFTGEPKKYPLTRLPQRSLQHWIGLLCLCFFSLGFTLLQTRAAFALSMNWDLPWVTQAGLWWLIFPFFILGLLVQWCAVLIEVSIVLAQWGVVVWWIGWAVNIFT